MERIRQIFPELLGAAQLISTEGGWQTLSSVGEFDVHWALRVLRVGETALHDELDTATEEVEAVIADEHAIQIVVADAKGAVVLRLARGANLGMAIGFAHGVVRSRAA